MKTPLILAALLLGALATAPAGQAHVIPVIDTAKCTTVHDFPDLGWQVCYDLEDGECTVYEYRTTIVGTEKDCLYPDAEASSAAAIGVPDLSQWPKCFPAAVGQLCFSPYWPGCNLWIVWTAIPHPPTCLYRSDPGPLAAQSMAGTPPCYEVYRETHLAGPYWLVQRNSCSAQLYQCPDGYSPPAPPCEEVPILEASSTSSAPASEPNCLQYYRETEVGPVTHVQRDSCHSETYVCEDDDGVHEKEETLMAFIGGQTTQPDEAKLQGCIRGTLDDYIAWG